MGMFYLDGLSLQGCGGILEVYENIGCQQQSCAGDGAVYGFFHDQGNIQQTNIFRPDNLACAHIKAEPGADMIQVG